MILYRAMCDKELESMKKFNTLSWHSKFKWFGTEEFVSSRVRDNKFNNSNFIPSRYKNLIKIEFSEDSMPYFNKCGHREFMLNIRKVPMIKILSWEICDE